MTLFVTLVMVLIRTGLKMKTQRLNIQICCFGAAKMRGDYSKSWYITKFRDYYIHDVEFLFSVAVGAGSDVNQFEYSIVLFFEAFKI
jgi:hypothetical protein